MKNLQFWYLLIFSIIVVTICSDTSPLYHFSPSPDPSCFFSAGRAIREGLIPYVDVADSKGIYLMLLYSGITYIDNTSFFGVYIVQCITLFITLIFSQKTAEMFISEKGSNIAVLLLCLFLFDSYFYQRGGGAEELLWPFMAALVYCLAGAFVRGGESRYKLLYAHLGVFMAVSLMMKYSITVPIAGLTAALFAFDSWNKGVKSSVSHLSYTIACFTIVLLPGLIYLCVVGCMQGFVDEYLLCSFRYGVLEQTREWYIRVLRPLPLRCLSDFLMLVTIIWAIKVHGLRSLYKNRPLLMLLLSIVLLYALYKGEMLSIYIPYYNSILSPLMLACCIFIASKIERKMHPFFVSIMVVFVLFLGSLNGVFGAVTKGDFIWEKSSKPDLAFEYNKKVLYMGWLDRGFGVPYNWIPCGRYWFLQNFPSQQMILEQKEYIKKGIPDVIHTLDKKEEAFFNRCGYHLFYEFHDNYFYKRSPESLPESTAS